jgi:hypothetical protein
MRAERVHAMLTRHGLRAEIIRNVEDTSVQPVVWIPSQDYARAIDLMARMAESGPSPCDVCPSEAEGRFDLCWTCEER